MIMKLTWRIRPQWRKKYSIGYQILRIGLILHDLFRRRAPRRACVSLRSQVSPGRGEENGRGCRSDMKGPDGDTQEARGHQAGTAGLVHRPGVDGRDRDAGAAVPGPDAQPPPRSRRAEPPCTPTRAHK